MLRKLPRRFTAWDLVAELEHHVHRSSFDYIYVPWDKEGANSLGFAFVNFVSPEVAGAAFRLMDNSMWRVGYRAKPMRLASACLQGLEENLRHFAEQPHEHDDLHMPLVFDRGVQVSVETAMSRLIPAAARHPPSCQWPSSSTSCGLDLYTGSSTSDSLASLPGRQEQLGTATAALRSSATSAVPDLDDIKLSEGYAAAQDQVIALLKCLLSK